MMTKPTKPKRQVTLTLRKKLFFSAMVTICFFVTLECTLGFVGFRPHATTEDPFVGFSGLIPLMEVSTNEHGEEVLSTAPIKRHWFNDQSFTRVKRAGTKRVFCMGGSTTYGHPYWDSTSFPGWLREFLPVVDASHQWEVINAGGISYASYRVAALMEELANYEPDLFIVYSVHNEFLERRTYENMFETSTLGLRSRALLSHTRTWALADRVIDRVRTFTVARKPSDITPAESDVLRGEVDEILNHTIGPVDYHRNDDWKAKVLLHYEANLRRMVQIARRAGAEIVFITPAANEKDCSPFKSETNQGVSVSDEKALLSILDQAKVYPAGKEAMNLSDLQQAIKIDSRYAETLFRLGQAYLAVDRNEEAKQAFVRALSEDVCPLRAIPEIRAAIERVALESNTTMVDFEKKLRQLCETEHAHSIFGNEYFLDHVHPTIDVNRRLAIWIIEELQAKKILRGIHVNDLVDNDRLSTIEAKVLGEIDRNAQAVARRNLAKVFHWAGKFEEAIPHANAVFDAIPNDLESRYILARCMTHLGREEEAIQQYERLFSDGVDYPRAYLHFGELLARRGLFERAKAYLLMAVLYDDKNAAAYHSLGLVHLQLSEFQFAVESFEESNRLYPGDSQTLLNLAAAKAERDKASTTNKPSETL